MSQTKAQLISDLVQALNFTGTASAPANGAFLSAANTLALATNSGQRLTIDSDGRVAIGHNTPSSFSSAANNLVVSTSSGNCGISINATATNANSNLFFTDGTGSGENGAGRVSYEHQNNAMAFTTDSNERLRIDSSGNVAIGTTTADNRLHIESSSNTYLQIEKTGTSSKVYVGNASGGAIVESSGGTVSLKPNSAANKFILDTSGRMLLGISTARENFGNNTSGVAQQIQLEGTSAITSSMSLIRNSNDINDGGIIVGKTRGTSVGSNTVVQAGDDLGNITFAGSDGTSLLFGADIKATVESGVGNDDMPAALVFSTNGGITYTAERMRIDSSGRLLIGTTAHNGPYDGITPQVVLEGTSYDTSTLTLFCNANAVGPAPQLQLGKSRGTTDGSNTIVANGDRLASIWIVGADGTDRNSSFAAFDFRVDGVPGVNDTPGRIEFKTTSDGSANPSERMRLNSSGRLVIGTTAASGAGNSQYSLFEVSGNTSGATGPGHLSIKRGTASASLSNGDTIGRLIFSGLDGGDFAFIQASVDADNTTDFPGRLMFYTCADGATSATERMRIDHSGKVGINNTSLNADFSVSNSNTSQNSAFVDIGKAGGERFKLGYEGNNCFFGGSASSAMFIFKNNVTQSENPQASGNERMRLDGSGRLMLGTTTSTSNQSGRLNVFGTDGDSAFVSIRRGSDNASGPRFAMCKSRNTTDGAASGLVQDGDILGTIHFYANDSQGFEEGAAIQATIDGTPGSNDVPTMIKFQTTPDGSDTKQERMRIKQDGNVVIGKTSNFGNGGTTGIELNGGSHYSMFVRQSNTPMYVGRNTTTGIIVSYLYNGTQRGTISTDGTVIALTGTSDYRLKENNITISDGIARLKQLKPYRFNFKETPSKTIDGFFAHEVDLVVPEAVFGDKDAVATEEDVQSGLSVGDIKPQQLDQSKLVPLLTAALQEEISKREALEARVAALEAA